MALVDASPSGDFNPPQHWLNWTPTPGGIAGQLREVLRDLAAARGVSGVYLIWADRAGSRTWMFAGEAGDLGSRLQRHQTDIDMNGAASGQLHVAWAPVATVHRQGVLRYLVDMLAPRDADPLTAARPMPVNLPQ